MKTGESQIIVLYIILANIHYVSGTVFYASHGLSHLIPLCRYYYTHFTENDAKS